MVAVPQTSIFNRILRHLHPQPHHSNRRPSSLLSSKSATRVPAPQISFDLVPVDFKNLTLDAFLCKSRPSNPSPSTQGRSTIKTSSKWSPASFASPPKTLPYASLSTRPSPPRHVRPQIPCAARSLSIASSSRAGLCFCRPSIQPLSRPNQWSRMTVPPSPASWHNISPRLAPSATLRDPLACHGSAGTDVLDELLGVHWATALTIAPRKVCTLVLSF